MSIKLSKSVKFLVFAAALFSAFFVSFSCSNLFDDINVASSGSGLSSTDGKTVTITGAVSNSQGEAVQKEPDVWLFLPAHLRQRSIP